jgi:hypothetical protein
MPAEVEDSNLKSWLRRGKRRKDMNKAKVFGRIVGLSTLFATLVVIVFYGLATTHPVVHARVQDENATTGCTLATLTGNYGVLANGLNGTGPFTDVGIFEPNGVGKFVLNFTQNFNGKSASYSGAGTYTLHSNCTGTMTLTVDGITSTYAFVVVTNGNEIDVMTTIPTAVQTWVAKKIN